MSKIIISGGLGFIGTNLISELLKENHQILNLDKNGYSSNKFFLRSEKNYQLIKFDISLFNQNKLDKIVKKFQPKFLINLAAESHVDRSIETPFKIANQNISLTIKLLISSLRYQKYKKNFKFVHIGTDEIYGDINLSSDYKFNESSCIKPNNPYSASKASCNNFVRAFHKTYNLNSLIINPANNYGEFQLPEKFIPRSIMSLIQNKPVEIYGSGKNMRNWTHVSDTVNGIKTILKKGKNGEIYNISSNDCLSNNHIVKLLKANYFKYFKKRSRVKYVQDRPGHDLKYSLNNNKLKKLGWKPKIKFSTGIQKTFEWYLNKENLQYFSNLKNFKNRIGKSLL